MWQAPRGRRPSINYLFMPPEPTAAGTRGSAARGAAATAAAGRRRGRRGGLRLGLFDVDASFKQSAVFNADSGSNDIADELGVFADIYLVGGFHVALNLAEDDHFAGANAGLDTAIRSDGDLIILRFDGTFDIAINIQILFGEDLTDDFDCLSDGRGISRLGIGGPK